MWLGPNGGPATAITIQHIYKVGYNVNTAGSEVNHPIISHHLSQRTDTGTAQHTALVPTSGSGRGTAAGNGFGRPRPSRPSWPPSARR